MIRTEAQLVRAPNRDDADGGDERAKAPGLRAFAQQATLPRLHLRRGMPRFAQRFLNGSGTGIMPQPTWSSFTKSDCVEARYLSMSQS